MAKQVSVEIEVNSSQVDQTVQKLGQLKDLGKGLKIQYDIDGRPLDVVIDKSKNLQQQVKILTAELRKTKEGTAEFQLLSTKLGDAQDQLTKTTAKSKDLFTSLSMIPGPVGQFFSQLQGGIELLKTFSSFSFKDLSFQFKETANDIADIGKNLNGIDSNNIDNVEKSSSDLGDTLQNTAAQAGGTSAALSNVAKSSNQVVDASGKVTTAAENAASAATKEGQTFKFLTTAQAANVNVTRQATVATNQLAASEATATVATNTLGAAIKGALIGTGIGIAIVLIGEIVSKLMDYFNSSKKAEKAANDFSDAIKRQNEILEANLGQIDFENKKKLLQAKIAGESEKELNQITQEGLENRYNLIRNANSAALLEQQNLAKRVGKYAKISDEERSALLEKNLENLKKLGDDETKAREAVELSKLQIQATAAGKSRDLSTKYNQKQIDASKTADDIAITNIREIATLKLTEERDRQKKELENQKLAEEDKIKALEITTIRKNELIAQIDEKYGLKLKDLNKKFKDDDIKAAEEFTKKLGDITISAIEDETKRQIAAREEKYSNDIKDLERDKEFIKLSEETKAFYRSELIKAKEQDIAKIRLEAKIKEYQDELMLLEAQQRALIVGTEAYQANAIAIENTAYQIKLANAKDNAKQIEAVNAEHAANLKAIDLASFEAKKQIEIQRYQVVANIGQSLQALAGKQKGIAIAGVVIEKAAAIGQIWANNAIANAKATAVSPLTFGQPWVTVNTVSAVLSTAATVAAAAKAISEINNSAGSSSTAASGGTTAQPAMANYGKNYEKGGMIGGRRHAEGGTLIEAEKGEAIISRGAVTMFAPMLSMMNQMGGGTSFAPSLMTTSYDAPITAQPSQEQSPIIVKSYVVSSDMTSAQEKNARLKDLSTL